jgi:hypothetical protein
LWLKDCAEKPQPTASVGGHFKPVTVLVSSSAIYHLIGDTGICQLQQSKLFGFFSFGFQGEQQ